MISSRSFLRVGTLLFRRRNCRKCSSLSPSAAGVVNREEECRRPETTTISVELPHGNIDLTQYIEPLKPSFHVAAYADKAELLQRLMDIGVEVHKFDSNPALMKYILQMDFERDVKPYLHFLYRQGVPLSQLGSVISKNPYLFYNDLDNLQVRINYMESKNFTKEMIGKIICNDPRWLSLNVVEIDTRLGYLQKEYRLKGVHVREIITKCPRIGTIKKEVLILNGVTLKEEFELELHNIRSMLLKAPHILIKDNKVLVEIFNYLLKEMHIPMFLIVDQPEVFSTRKHIIHLRHSFLKHLGRAQYNNKLPGYISLKAMIDCNDEEFCQNVAKTDVKLFDEYIKLF